MLAGGYAELAFQLGFLRAIIQKENEMSNQPAGAELPRAPKEIERIQTRLDSCNEHLHQAASRLENLSDRIQGSIPREAAKLTKTDAEIETPSSTLQGVHYQIDRVSRLSDQIHETIARLEEL